MPNQSPPPDESVEVHPGPTPQIARPEPIPALTGLRIIGAAWVALFHFQPMLYEAWSGFRAIEPVLGIGDYGVPLFFILSGYIIWHNYARRDLLSPRATARFIWRRFARLWPVNLLTQILAVPLILWSVVAVNYWGAPIPGWLSVGGWLGSALMVGGLDDAQPVFAWNQPSWTLTGEMFAYVVFPAVLAVALLVRVERGRHRWPWLIAALAVAVALKMPWDDFPFRWIVDLVIIFLVGVMLRIAGRPQRFSWLTGALQIAAPLGLLVVSYVGPGTLIIPLLAVWVWSLSAPSGPIVALFSTRPFQIAGLSSYSLYMLHWVLFGYLSLWLYYNEWARADLLPVYVVVAFVALAIGSWALWKFVEAPARESMNRAFEKLWPRRRAPADHRPDVGDTPERVG